MCIRDSRKPPLYSLHYPYRAQLRARAMGNVCHSQVSIVARIGWVPDWGGWEQKMDNSHVLEGIRVNHQESWVVGCGDTLTSKGLYSAEHNRGWARVLRQVDVQQVKEVEPVDMQVTVNPPLGEWRATSVCVGPQPGPPPPLLLRRRKGDWYERYSLVGQTCLDRGPACSASRFLVFSVGSGERTAEGEGRRVRTRQQQPWRQQR